MRKKEYLGISAQKKAVFNEEKIFLKRKKTTVFRQKGSSWQYQDVSYKRCKNLKKIIKKGFLYSILSYFKEESLIKDYKKSY
jgi:hypothetical protein